MMEKKKPKKKPNDKPKDTNKPPKKKQKHFLWSRKHIRLSKRNKLNVNYK